MKYRALFLYFFIAVSLYGQSQRSKPAIYFLKAQGGFLADLYEEEDNYYGFNMASSGWARHKNGVLQGIDLEFVNYDFSWRVDRQSYELSYFRTYAVKGDISNGLFIGGFASLGIYDRRFNSSSISVFPYETKCRCIALGPKLDYVYALNRSFYLFVSTRITLLDVGTFERQGFEVFRPQSRQYTSEFRAEFLRDDIPVLVGIGIKL